MEGPGSKPRTRNTNLLWPVFLPAHTARQQNTGLLAAKNEHDIRLKRPGTAIHDPSTPSTFPSRGGMLYISSAQLIPSPHYPLSPHLPAPQAKWLNVPPTFSQWPHPRSFSPPIWHRSAPILAAERCGAHWPAIILAVSTHPHPPSSPPTRHRPDPALAAGQCAAHRSHPHGT